MSTTTERASAVIYQFPKGGRAAVGVYRAAKLRQDVVDMPVIDTDAWYHDAALKDEPKH